jgi:nucleoid-associated protein YgaU
MDQRIRLTVATAVMLVGLGLALCFRRESGNTAVTLPPQGDLVAVGKQPERNIVVLPAPPAPRPLPVATQDLRHPSTTVVTPSDQPAPPPEFPKSYSSPNQTANSQAASNLAAANKMTDARWNSTTAEILPERRAPLPKHRIVDGDTLPLLAERYLGSATRASEIFDANRDVLSDPSILRIGAVLKIPGNKQ